jgi:hypothetical protein
MSKFQASLLNAASMPIWPVWSGSTTAEVEFRPMPKKRAGRLFQKARAHDHATRKPGSGKHGGALGRIALNVMQVLLFDFMNYATGRLDPSIEAIARKAGCCATAAKNALKKLREHGFLTWVRRARPETDASGGFLLRQETNAYAVLSEESWRGYHDPAPPSPEPWQWGACPSLPGAHEAACIAIREGDGPRAVVAALEAEPADGLAAALARMGRTMLARNPSI